MGPLPLTSREHKDVCVLVNVCGPTAHFEHSLPSLIFDILWPCMADRHQLVVQRKIITPAC